MDGLIIASVNLFQEQCLPTLTSRKYPDVSSDRKPLDISQNYSLGIRFKLYFVQYVWETLAREKILLRAGATNFQQSSWRNSVIKPIFCGRFSCISETQLVVLHQNNHQQVELSWNNELMREITPHNTENNFLTTIFIHSKFQEILNVNNWTVFVLMVNCNWLFDNCCNFVLFYSMANHAEQNRVLFLQKHCVFKYATSYVWNA